MAQFLYRLGALGVRRRGTFLLVWPLVIAAIAVVGVAFAGSFQSSSSIPGSPAQTALVRMDQHFANADVETAQILFQAPPGRTLAEPALAGPVRAAAAQAAQVAGVTNVSRVLGDGSVSPDGRTAVMKVAFSTASTTAVPVATLDALRASAGSVEQAGARVVFGGDAFVVKAATFGPAELLSVGVALLVLIVTFGSLLAAGLPLIVPDLSCRAHSRTATWTPDSSRCPWPISSSTNPETMPAVGARALNCGLARGAEQHQAGGDDHVGSRRYGDRAT